MAHPAPPPLAALRIHSGCWAQTPASVEATESRRGQKARLMGRVPYSEHIVSVVTARPGALGLLFIIPTLT